MAQNLNVFKDIKKELAKAINKKLMLEVAKEARKIIVIRTKGRETGVDSVTKASPSPKKLPGHSDSYIDYRERYEDFLDAFTKVGTANLTLSGQLLNSIKANARQGNASIFIPDTKRKALVPGHKAPKISNKELAQVLQTKMGRPFFALTGDEQKVLTQIIDEALRKVAKKYS